MKILVINAGSSSLKYQLIDMDGEVMLAKGNCERIGIDGGHISHKKRVSRDSDEFISYDEDVNFADHTEAFLKLVWALTESDAKVIDDMSEIGAVGHRVVQGAEKFDRSVLVTEEVVQTIDELAELAPLHNKAHVQGIRACQSVLDQSVPQVVVFDTAFHQTMPEKAYMFGVPYEYYEKYHVRRYGAHGTSHRYVSQRAAQLMGKDVKNLKIVTCHLGNGSSISAVNGGKCVDTSMGLTPLGGILMGTRSGSLDPSVVTYLMQRTGMNAAEMDTCLNKKSGYLGLSGVSSDHRDLCAAMAKGNRRARLALEVQAYQIQKYIGAYAAAMNGLDAVVFTGGIGENAADTREMVCENMEFMGLHLDRELNRVSSGKEIKISEADSPVQIWIVPTNEELAIARDTLAIAESLKK